MHSYLIVSQSEETRNKKAGRMVEEALELAQGNSTSNPDFLLISNEDKSSIGIEKVRDLISWLTIKPFQSKSKVVLIKDAHLLTLEAQNALLKTLEEPPGNSKIILTCSHKSRLLPTIVSRCAVISLQAVELNNQKDGQDVKGNTKFLEILNSDIGKKLDFTEENKDLFSKKGLAVETIDSWLNTLESILRQTGDKATVFKIDLSPEQVTEASRGLLSLKKEVSTTNVSPRNLVELFLIKL